MRPQRINVLRAASWLALGLGVGSGSTLVFQQWATSSTPMPEERAEQQPPPEAALTTELLLKGEPVLGSGQAPLTIVEFSDFECPYCRLFHEQVFQSLQREYIDAGLVRFIHKDLPLPFHEQARPAAAAARCAGAQNRYWDLYSASSINRGASNARASSKSPKKSISTPQAFMPACNKTKLRHSLMPIFLKPNCTISAPRQPS